MDSEKAIKKHQQMTEEGMLPLMLKLALPSGIAMIVIALYSLADALYVSGLGTEAGAAVGICFGIQATIQAVSYTLGVGAGSLLSRSLGKKEHAEAARFARVSFFLSIASGITILGVGLFWGKGLINFLGATDEIHPYAMAYARNLLFSAPFMCASFVMSQLLRAEGKAVYSMVGLLVGSLANIILDPIFIYSMHIGIAGASLATWISQMLSFAILLSAYCLKKSQIRLLYGFSWSDFSVVKWIIPAGLPSFGRQGLTALATVLLNHATAAWGNSAVAAMSVVSRIFLLAFSVCLGIGQGMMPITGYNYGYCNFKRTKQAFLIALLSSSILMLLIAIPVLIFTPQLIALFRSDSEVVAIGTRALRAQAWVFVLHGLITCTNMLLQSIGKQVSATLLACARQGFFFLPLIRFLPDWFGIEFLIYVQPLADLLTFLFAIPFTIYSLRHLSALKKEMPAPSKHFQSE